MPLNTKTPNPKPMKPLPHHRFYANTLQTKHKPPTPAHHEISTQPPIRGSIAEVGLEPIQTDVVSNGRFKRSKTANPNETLIPNKPQTRARRCQRTSSAHRLPVRSAAGYLGRDDARSWGGKIIGCLGDLVSRLSKGPYRAYYGLLWGLTGDTNWTY